MRLVLIALLIVNLIGGFLLLIGGVFSPTTLLKTNLDARGLALNDDKLRVVHDAVTSPADSAKNMPLASGAVLDNSSNSAPPSMTDKPKAPMMATTSGTTLTATATPPVPTVLPKPVMKESIATVTPEKLKDEKPAPTPRTPATEQTCLQLDNLNDDERKRTQRWLQRYATHANVSSSKQSIKAVAGGRTTWWIMIPSQGDATKSMSRLQSLRRHGINDAYVINKTGADQWGISLGVFRDQNGAKRYFATLQEKGLKDVVLVKKNTGTEHILYRVTARNLATPIAHQLSDLAKTRFTKPDIKQCSE